MGQHVDFLELKKKFLIHLHSSMFVLYSSSDSSTLVYVCLHLYMTLYICLHSSSDSCLFLGQIIWKDFIPHDSHKDLNFKSKYNGKFRKCLGELKCNRYFFTCLTKLVWHSFFWNGKGITVNWEIPYCVVRMFFCAKWSLLLKLQVLFSWKTKYSFKISGEQPFFTLNNSVTKYSQPAITCSKLSIETLEQGMINVQS